MNGHQWYQFLLCQSHLGKEWWSQHRSKLALGDREDPHPPLLKEVCLTESHIDLTFTSIEESPEECGTSLDVSSKQAMRFVDEPNSNLSHPCFDHGSHNVHLVHVNTW